MMRSCLLAVRRAGRIAGALALAAGLLCSGCGFRLSGQVELPRVLATADVRTEADAQSDFYRGLRTRLTQAGTRLLDEPGAERASAPVIRVLEDGYSEEVLTVSARNVPTAYELRYRVRIAVQGASGELLAPESFELRRDYSFDQTALLAKERERDVLLAALADELAALVLQRLASL